MFGRKVFSFALAGALLLTAAATASICTMDRRPGASALVPYFEVGSVNVAGTGNLPERTTLFSLVNTDPVGTIVHLAVWSEFAVPVLEFQVYLRGFGEQSFNMEDIILRGVLPVTTLPSNFPDLFPECTPGFQFPLPFIPDPDDATADPIQPLPSAAIASFLQKALTGEPVNPRGGTPRVYASRDHEDPTIARGYVTIDVIDSCVSNFVFPGRGGIFGQGGRGLAKNRNILIGDVSYVKRAAPGSPPAAAGISLVTLEASAADRRTTQAPEGTTRYTFYAPFVHANAADNREPLATVHAVRFIHGESLQGGTDIIYWRDPKLVRLTPFQPGTTPSWYPLGQEQIIVFDESSRAVVGTEPGLAPFRFASGRVAVTQVVQKDGLVVPLDFPFGWLRLNLNTSTPGGVLNPVSQSFVAAILSASSRVSVGVESFPLDSACAPKLNPLDPISLPLGGNAD